MRSGLREYKGEMFRKFALKLKKEGLWQRFIITEYYLRFYSNPMNNLNTLIDCYKNENDDYILYKSFFDLEDCRGSYFDGINEDIKLSEFFRHYKV